MAAMAVAVKLHLGAVAEGLEALNFDAFNFEQG